MNGVSKLSKLVFLSFIAVSVLLVMAAGCGSSEPSDTGDKKTDALPPGVTIIPAESPTPSKTSTSEFSVEKAQNALAKFLSATDLHIKGQYSSVYVDGSKEGPTPFEIWQKDGNIRIDYYKDGALYRTLIVSDNKALFYIYKSKVSTPSIMPAGYYSDLLRQGALTAASQLSDDKESAVFSFAIDKFYKTEGAQSGYYVTKINYCVNSDTVLYQVVYGKDSSGAKPTAVNTVTQTFSLVEINGDVDDALFRAPF